jgi:hypothetical protein
VTRNGRFVCAVLTVGLLGPLLLGLSPALADQSTPAVIQETSIFHTDHQPPSGTFTASGIPGCASGTFSDQLVSFSPSGARLILDRTYVCDGGGAFTARVALHLQPVDAAGQQTVTGTWRIVSADGIPSLSGSGTTVGVNTGCTPIGTVFATCTSGTGTIFAKIH